MSLNPVMLEKVCVIDPVLNYNPRKYAILKGAKEHTWVDYNTQNFSNSNATITTNPPNRGSTVDLQILQRITYTLAFTGTTPNGGNLLEIGSNDAPRAYPIAQTTTNITAKIGNTSVSTALNQYFNALIRSHNSSMERIGFHSMTPSMLDFYQNYDDCYVFGTSRNALSNVGENGAGDEGRGGWSGITNLVNGATSASLTLQVTEPIFMSPFLFTHNESSGLIGVDQMIFIYSFGDLTRVWSHNAISGNPITSLTVNIQSVELLIPYLTPDLFQPISRQNTWPYYELDYYPNMVTAPLASGAQQQLNINNMQLRSIPSRLYIFVARDQTDQDYTTTDTFARIDQLQLNFNNKNGTFSEASTQNLYNISRNNGLSMSWNQWNMYTGSVFICEFGKDVPLQEDEAGGVLGNYQLSAKIWYTNLNNDESIVFTTTVIAVNEGSISIQEGTVKTAIGIVTPSDALNAYNYPQVSYKASEVVFGGDFLGSLKNFFSSAYRVGKRAVNEFAPIVRDVSSIYSVAKPFLGKGRRRSSRRRSSRRRTSRRKSRRRSRRRSSRGRGVIVGGVGVGGKRRKSSRRRSRSRRKSSRRKSSRRKSSRRGRGMMMDSDLYGGYYGGSNNYSGGQMLSRHQIHSLATARY